MMISQSKKKSRKRKQRMIKNAIINVDDVNSENNSNWLKIAKQKLAEREFKLLHKRQLIVDRIVMNVIHSFIDQNMKRFNFNQCAYIYKEEISHHLISEKSPIMMRCAQDIAATLKKWRGPKAVEDEENDSFRSYFQRCRHWFDSKKMNIMTNDFWIPIMTLIKEFATKYAKYSVNHQSRGVYQSSTDYLNVLILKSIFEGQMKPSNARKMWLVPAMSYPKILRNYNQNLEITLDRPTKNAKECRKQYLQCLNEKCNNLLEAFDNEMNEYCVLMNASHVSLPDNYNISNHQLIPSLVAPDEKYSNNQTDHNNNISSSPPGARAMPQIYDAPCFVPVAPALFSPRFNSLSFGSNHTNHNVNQDANVFAYNQAQYQLHHNNDPSSAFIPNTGNNYINESRSSYLGDGYNYNAINHHLNQAHQLLQNNEPFPPFIPPQISNEHNSGTNYLYENCNCCDCNQLCSVTLRDDVDRCPFNNQYSLLS